MVEVTITELASPLSTLRPTILAIHLAPLYIRYLQRRQIEVLRATTRFTSKACLYHLCIEELNWQVINLSLSNGESIVTQKPELASESDASITGW